MSTARTFTEVRGLCSGTVGLIPTMGFLHEGHLSLIETASESCDTVVVSVFVNPLQFGDPRDLEAYPRNVARDEKLARQSGANVVFVPDLDEMYGTKHVVLVKVAGVGDAMEGVHRPGHFDGVATVVAKLFSGIQPDRAFFGRKDAQQLALVSTMASGLSMPVEVIGCSIVRESDGLALSSRNTRLSAASRAVAPSLSEALFGAHDRFLAGERNGNVLNSLVRSTLVGHEDVALEYVEVADIASARVIEEIVGPSFLAVAANVGGVRLIDNVSLDGQTGSSDVGVRLEKQSILYGA